MNAEVVCFGEILWDVFPDKKVVGGAPLNVALRLHSFGVNAQILSCLGKDELAEGITVFLKSRNFPLHTIQTTPELPTGTVQVTLDAGGSARYEIVKPVAWDFIRPNEQLFDTVKDAKVFIFGSLAIRGMANRKTLSLLLQKAQTKVFDVNLRAPHYDISMVYELMQLSDVVKVNDEELDELCDKLGGPIGEATMEEKIDWMQRVTKVNTICVTCGGDGAILLENGTYFKHPGFSIDIADTVGAGDSFLATLVYHLLLRKSAPEKSLEYACAMGALVASKAGANCEVEEREVLAMVEGEE